jgi:hypothetical protein
MDKKTKQHRQKLLTRDELGEIAPRGASFDTDEGRAAQGMRKDIGSGGGETVDAEGAVGASNANSGAGIPDVETGITPQGESSSRGDSKEDREKLFPEAKAKAASKRQQ